MAFVRELRTRLPASLLHALPDAVIACGSDLEIVYANASCERLFGYERKELGGRSITSLIPGGLPGGEQPNGRVTIPGRTKDGRRLSLDVVVSRLERRAGALMVVTVRENRPDFGRGDDFRRSEGALRAVLEGLPDAVVATSPDGLIAFVNARAEELFGYTGTELVGGPVELLWPEGLREPYARVMRRFLSDRVGLNFTREVRGRRKDGSEFAGEMTWGVVETEFGPLMLAVGRDISERLEAAQRLGRHSAERAVVAALGERALAGADPADLAGQVADAVAKTVEVGMVQVLELVPGTEGELRSLAGWSRTEDPNGALAEAAAEHARAAAGSRGKTVFAMPELAAGQPGGLAQAGVRSGMAVTLRSGDDVFGVLAVYAWRENALDEDDGAFLQAVANVLATAISRRRMDLRLRHQALHDPLTGLANRTLCKDRLAQAVARARRSGGGIGLLYIDLDGFKRVNDRHGHAAGDEVLAAFARRLTDAVRPSDTVGRVGGDEFLVICEDVNEKSALALGDRLAAAARRPIEAGGAEHRLSASIGIALSRGHAPDPDALTRTADAAAYEAKRADEDVRLAVLDQAGAGDPAKG